MTVTYSTANIYYYSSQLGMTRRIVNKLPFSSYDVKGSYRRNLSQIIAEEPYILFAPTYYSERDKNYLHRSQKEFLLTEDNSSLLRGVVGIGNRNFGNDYCKSADVVSNKFHVPIVGKIELAGEIEDVDMLTERIQEILNEK